MFSSYFQLLHKTLNCYFFSSLLPDDVQISLILPLQQFFRFSFHPLDINFLRRYSSSLSKYLLTSPSTQTPPFFVKAHYAFQLCGLVFSNHHPYFIMTEISKSSFTTSKATLNIKDNFFTLPQFIGNIFLDLGLILIAIILWRFFWYSLEKLKIMDIRKNVWVAIDKTSSIWNVIGSLFRILKNMNSFKNNYIMSVCGFEAYSYMFFLRRFTHLMSILAITDLCIWIPYQLYFNSIDHFSLASMESSQNNLFRTFYTLWVSIAVLYAIKDMQKYLKIVLKNRLLRTNEKTNQRINERTNERLVNNLKSKTVLIHFIGEKEQMDQLTLKTKLVDQLKIQDRVIACLQLKNNSRKIQVEYEYKIYKLVQRIGINNFSKIWRFFKQVEVIQMQKRINDKINSACKYKSEINSPPFNSFLVVFENITTAETLVNQFESSRSFFDIIPQSDSSSQIESLQQKSTKIAVSWAQQPSDVMWINIGASQKVKLIKYILFNSLSFVLIAVGVLIVVLSRSQKIINIPRILLPMIISTINSSLRWLISKSSQWQNRHFQYELQMKQLKVLTIFFVINVLVGSLVRDTLNLIDILTTGWGWLQLFGLVYKKPDGFFYYGFILNEIAFTAFAVFFKMGDLFPQVFNSGFTYLKNQSIRHQSKYGTNDTFRYGYNYSLDIIVFAIIFMYSTSAPLIHFFGFLYFYSKFFLFGYTLTVFHRYQQTCSNLRMLQKVCQYVQIIMMSSIFLMGTTMMFESQYSSVLILYFWEGVILWIMFNSRNSSHFLKDYVTDEQLKTSDISQIVCQWKRSYNISMELDKKIESKDQGKEKESHKRQK